MSQQPDLGTQRDAARLLDRHAEQERRHASTLSLVFNAVSTVLKFAVALFTGSVSVLSEAIHSATDVAAAMLAAYGVRAAAAPPDEEHPYGHGKIEALGSFGEALLLFAAVLYVLWESVQRLMHPSEIQRLDLGIVLMAGSAIGAGLVARRVLAAARSTESLALAGNGQHLLADCYTSVGVLVGLATVRFTGWIWADAVVAIGLSGWMAWSALRLARAATNELVDQRLPQFEIEAIEAIVSAEPHASNLHRLRTRRSGHVRYIDMHVEVPREWNVVQAHDLADRLERHVEERLAPAHVVVHIDPADWEGD